MCRHGSVAPVMLTDRAGDLVAVDRCIAQMVQALNDAGFKTVASCCGHGYRPGMIALADGRELMICRDFEEARRVNRLFPLDIHGDALKGCPTND